MFRGHTCSPWGSAEWAQATQERTVRKPPSSQKASLAACGAASRTASSSAAAERAVGPPLGASMPSRMRALFSSRRSAACTPFACLRRTAGLECNPNNNCRQRTTNCSTRGAGGCTGSNSCEMLGCQQPQHRCTQTYRKAAEASPGSFRSTACSNATAASRSSSCSSWLLKMVTAAEMPPA